MATEVVNCDERVLGSRIPNLNCGIVVRGWHIPPHQGPDNQSEPAAG